MERGQLRANPTLAAQLFADYLLFGTWPCSLWDLREDVLEELRFYMRHVKVPSAEEPDDSD